MSAVAATPCPVCHGEMWDETTSKYYDPSKNRPIAKCKNKECKGAVWPPRNGAAPVQRASAPAPTRAPLALGASLPYEEEAQATDAPPVDPFAALAALYRRSLKEATVALAGHGIDKMGGDVAGAVVAAAATIFIQASKGTRV